MKKTPRSRRPEPPAGRPSPPELFAIPKHGRVTLRLLGPALTMYQHPGSTRPIACAGEEHCPRSLHRGETRFKGYAPAERWRDKPYEDWLPCVLEITEALWRVMGKHELRGQVWTLWRGASLHSAKEVSGELVDQLDASRLRTDVTVKLIVHRVYGTDDILWGVEPPLEPVAPLAASTDGPPVNRRGKVVQPERLQAAQAEAANGEQQPEAAKQGEYANRRAAMERLRAARDGIGGMPNGHCGQH